MRSFILLTAAAGPAAATALSYVGEAVGARLSSPDLACQRGVTWDFSDKAHFSPGWLHYTPTGQLGKSTAELVVPAECTAAADGDACEADFGLFKCGEGRPSCRPAFPGGAAPWCVGVNSTVTAPNGVPTELCVGHSFSLVEEVYAAIVQTERYLDISTLSAPDGRFLAAVRNAFTFLHAKNQTIDVRVILGVAAVVPKTDIGGYIQTFLNAATRDIGSGPTQLRIAVGDYVKTGLDVLEVTWNHAKIIAVDGRLTLQGGHNLWTLDYLVSSPILDATMAVEGEIAMHGHRFLDEAWRYICGGGRGYLQGRWTTSFPKSSDPQFCPPVPLMPLSIAAAAAATTAAFVPAQDAVSAPAFSIGRLGNVGNVATSDKAIEAMFDSARTTIKLALQDEGPPVDLHVPFNWWLPGHRWIMVALCRALLRGVAVSVVQSGMGAMDAYGVGWSTLDVATVAAWYLSHPSMYSLGSQLSEAEIKNLVCSKLSVSTVHYLATESEWAEEARCPALWFVPTKKQPTSNCSATGSTSMGGHTKWWAVDDAAFYLGSQNLYPNNLAEWGVLVDDPSVTEQALDQFWRPLWRASQPYATSGPGADIQQCVAALKIPVLPLLTKGEVAVLRNGLDGTDAALMI